MLFVCVCMSAPLSLCVCVPALCAPLQGARTPPAPRAPSARDGEGEEEALKDVELPQGHPFAVCLSLCLCVSVCARVYLSLLVSLPFPLSVCVEVISLESMEMISKA